MTAWGPLVTRARGLSGHLIPRATMRLLAESPDRQAFVDALVRLGYLAFAPNAPAPDDQAVEGAIRRVAARRYAILDRWSRDCGDVLAPVVEDEDRRSLRALVRGAVGGVPPAERTRGLIPTRALPTRAIDEIALLSDVGAIGAALMAIGHPLARAVAKEARRERPDLFTLEQAVLRAWADRAASMARHGDHALRHYVERTIDLQNAWAARLLAQQHGDAEPDTLFVPGGTVITVGDLRAAANAGALEPLREQLAPRVRGTPLEAPLASDARAADEPALAALIAEYRGIARRNPLGLAPVLLYVMRLRAEHRALLRILWELALGVPPHARAQHLEAAA